MEDRPTNERQTTTVKSSVTDAAASPLQATSKPEGAVQEQSRLQMLGLIFLLILCASFGFAGGWLGSQSDLDTSTTVKQQQVVLEQQGELISSIAKSVGASVVSVNTMTQGVVRNSFFGYTSPTERQSAGTGIIISGDGLIITNRHVVPAGSTSVSVTLSDGTTFEGVEVVGRTTSRDSLDIAFLKIRDTKGKKLTAAKIGDSSKVQIGESVIAIGNALGQFENTVTSGIISGHGRSLQATNDDGSESENLENLFQTDAAINQGNSGGPLVNLNGEVIGINTAVAGGDAQSIGFAIPINDVKGLIKSVMDKGKLLRPYLGVIYLPITDDTAKQYDLSVTRGAYIAPANVIGEDPIIAGGPADKAGLKPGDIITNVNNDTIDQKNSLTALLGRHAVGDVVKLKVIRDGRQQNIDVTLAAAPTD